MKFNNIKRERIQTNAVGGGGVILGKATSMDVSCECGNSWHAVSGYKKGCITDEVGEPMCCPECNTRETYAGQGMD